MHGPYCIHVCMAHLDLPCGSVEHFPAITCNVGEIIVIRNRCSYDYGEIKTNVLYHSPDYHMEEQIINGFVKFESLPISFGFLLAVYKELA